MPTEHPSWRLRRPLRVVALALVPAVIGATACAGGSDHPAVATSDSAGVRIATVTAAPENVPEWRLHPEPLVVVMGAEAGDEEGFGQVGEVQWLGDERFVVSDPLSSRVLVFDTTGRLVRAFGRPGEGPGELRAIGSITTMPGDSVVTYDASLLRLSVWHPDAGFVRSTLLRGEDDPGAGIVNAWSWRGTTSVALHMAATPRPGAARGGGLRRWPMHAYLTLRDSTGQVVATSPTFDGPYTVLYPGGDTQAPWSHRPFAAVTAGRVYFGSGSAYAVSYLDSTFAWRGDVRWPARREPLTSAEVEEVQAELVARLAPDASPAPGLQARVARSFAPEILPDVRPAIGRVLVASDGRLWVERFAPLALGTPLPTISDQWTVLEPDGRPVARLRLPPRSRLEAVHGDRVALVVRNELDVQRVAVHAIVRP